MSAREWSLGEAPPPGYRLVREQIPNPHDRQKLFGVFQEILARGLVQKIVIQVNEPVEVLRLVKADEVDPSMDEAEVSDVYGAARNAQILEFPPRGIGSAQTLFFAFRTLERKNAVPHSILVSNEDRLKKWLGLDLDDDVESIFGVRVLRHEAEEVPDEVLLLVGGMKEDPSTVLLSLRIEMDLPGDRKMVVCRQPAPE